MSTLSREKIADHIYNSLFEKKESLHKNFNQSFNSIGYFYIDDVLPQDIALTIFQSFPKQQETIQKKSLKEHKHIAVQMNQYDPILEEVI